MSSVKKTSTRKTAAAAKPVAAHPTFIDMIKQCIIDTKEDSRTGVSRPTIKKYLATKFKLDMSSASNTSHLARAVKQGETTGVFLLPKGISGRVKLNKGDNNKENVKPTSASKPAPAKAPVSHKKKVAAAPAPAAKKAAPAKKAAAPARKAAAPAAKKAAATKKAAPAAKKTATKTKSSTSKAATATKAKAAPKKKAAAKKVAPKPVVAKKAAPRKAPTVRK